MAERKSPRAKADTRRLAIDRVEIIPLDIVPANKRRIPPGPPL